SCSSQAGRSLVEPSTAPAPASITSTRLAGPCPARRACTSCASHGRSRVHALLAHAQLEELVQAAHRMAVHEYTPCWPMPSSKSLYKLRIAWPLTSTRLLGPCDARVCWRR